MKKFTIDEVHAYWDARYQRGGEIATGVGSLGEYQMFKSKILSELIKKYEIKTLLDLGCGYGLILRNLENLTKIVGVDISPTAIHGATSFDWGSTEFEGHVLPLDKPLSLGNFDVVTCFDVLIHVPPTSRKQIIENCYRHSSRFVCFYTPKNSTNIQSSSHVFGVEDSELVYPGFDLLVECTCDNYTFFKIFKRT